MEILLRNCAAETVHLVADETPVVLTAGQEFALPAENGAVQIRFANTPTENAAVKKLYSSEMALGVLCTYDVSCADAQTVLEIRDCFYDVEGISKWEFGYIYFQLIARSGVCKLTACEAVNREEVLKRHKQFKLAEATVDRVLGFSFVLTALETPFRVRKIKWLCASDTILKMLGYETA